MIANVCLLITYQIILIQKATIYVVKSYKSTLFSLYPVDLEVNVIFLTTKCQPLLQSTFIAKPVIMSNKMIRKSRKNIGQEKTNGLTYTDLTTALFLVSVFLTCTPFLFLGKN